MGGVFKTVTFLVLVLAVVVVVVAEDHDVGGDSEWSRPSDPEFYTSWVAGKTFHVGDELEFEFAAGRHDVARVTKEAFADCEKEKPITIFRDPPVKVLLNTTGLHYFICTISDHCRFGQKIAVNVVAAGATGGGASGGAASGGGGATPTTPAGTTTPAGSGASSLSVSTFLVAIVSAFVALF